MNPEKHELGISTARICCSSGSFWAVDQHRPRGELRPAHVVLHVVPGQGALLTVGTSREVGGESGLQQLPRHLRQAQQRAAAGHGAEILRVVICVVWDFIIIMK